MYGGNMDPELQAQMQAWQNQYSAEGGNKYNMGRAGQSHSATPGNANVTPLTHNRLEGGSAPAAKIEAKATPAEEGVAKTVVRKGGGQTWEDPTLLEWGSAHRIFVGNLAGEVTDESLLKAFSKYPSVQKARVVRDKRTTKSKGFGFVSFTDADDYFKAAKEMNGKYIGSHPVLIKRSETNVNPVTKKDDQKGRNGKFNKNKGGKDKEKDVLGANGAGGVKKGKVEGKYKVLG